MTQPSKSDPPRFGYFASSSKGELHVAGAGTAGMYVMLVSLSMLFLASLAVYVIFRFKFPAAEWRPAGFMHLPVTLWVSTILLVGCSVTIHLALLSVRNDKEPALKAWLIATLVLGVAFLGVQFQNWVELWNEISADQHRGKFMVSFYMLTGLHAAHVLGGLLPLGVVTRNAFLSRYSRNFYPGVRYCTIYWHFLDGAWLIIFVALLLGT